MSLDNSSRSITVVKDSLTTEPDGKKYPTKHYNLDAVIAVGYRINSKPSFIALLNTEDSAMNSLSTVPRDMRPLNLHEGDLRRTSMQSLMSLTVMSEIIFCAIGVFRIRLMR